MYLSEIQVRELYTTILGKIFKNFSNQKEFSALEGSNIFFGVHLEIQSTKNL